MPKGFKPKAGPKGIPSNPEARPGHGAAPVSGAVGSVERKSGTRVLIEATLVQRTPRAICVLQGNDPERAAWLWNRDFEAVAELPDGKVRVRVDAAVADQRGLVGRDAGRAG